jgi:hypothetical protein
MNIGRTVEDIEELETGKVYCITDEALDSKGRRVEKDHLFLCERIDSMSLLNGVIMSHIDPHSLKGSRSGSFNYELIAIDIRKNKVREVNVSKEERNKIHLRKSEEI